MTWFLFGVAALHFAFMACELFPWSFPFLLRILTKKARTQPAWSPSQQALVATIVHNAGIYSGILTAGLLWVALGLSHDLDFTRFLLAGVAAAGLFGTITLKSPLTALQAALGVAGFFIMSH